MYVPGVKSPPCSVGHSLYLSSGESSEGGESLSYKDKPTQVFLTLSSHCLSHAISSIMKQCSLEGQLGEDVKHRLDLLSSSKTQQRDLREAIDDIFVDLKQRKRKRKQDIASWIRENSPLAAEKFVATEKLRKENERLISHLCHLHHLIDIKMDDRWTAATVKGYVRALSKLLGGWSQGLQLFQGAAGGRLSLAVGYRSGLCSDGCLHLFAEDTLQQWMKVCSEL